MFALHHQNQNFEILQVHALSVKRCSDSKIKTMNKALGAVHFKSLDFETPALVIILNQHKILIHFVIVLYLQQKHRSSTKKQ